MTEHALHSFFWPRSIAVLGASPDLHRIRGRLLHQLRENGFPGRILPINPSYQEIDGLRCYQCHRRGRRADRPGAGRHSRRRRRTGAGGMRRRRGEEHADHQLGFRRGRRCRRRDAGRAGGGDAAHRHSRLRSKLRRLLQRVGPHRDHVQPDGGNPGRRIAHAGIATPAGSDRAIRRHRLCPVQSRPGRRTWLQLRDLHRQRGRPHHGATSSTTWWKIRRPMP